MATFLICHGAWSAGWAWKKLRPLVRARGHEIHTPTYTGVGERSHLARPEIDLDHHIADVLAVIEFEDLRDIVLVGHSYGGMVATGVADRAADRISKLVYLDAFAPRDGQALTDLVGPEFAARMRKGAAEQGEGWRVPANPMPPDTPQADLDWAMPRRKTQPLLTLDRKIRLSGAVEKLPRSYIYCKRFGPGDAFRQFATRAQDEGWPYYELDASHNPHITMPETLADLLHRIAQS